MIQYICRKCKQDVGNSSMAQKELNHFIWAHFCDTHTEDMDGLTVFRSSIDDEEQLADASANPLLVSGYQSPERDIAYDMSHHVTRKIYAAGYPTCIQNYKKQRQYQMVTRK